MCRSGSSFSLKFLLSVYVLGKYTRQVPHRHLPPRPWFHRAAAAWVTGHDVTSGFSSPSLITPILLPEIYLQPALLCCVRASGQELAVSRLTCSSCFPLFPCILNMAREHPSEVTSVPTDRMEGQGRVSIPHPAFGLALSLLFSG